MNTCPTTQLLLTNPWYALSMGPWASPTAGLPETAGRCDERRLPGNDELELQLWSFIDPDGEDELYVKLSWMQHGGGAWADYPTMLFGQVGEIHDVALIGERAGTTAADDGEQQHQYLYEVLTDRGRYELIVCVSWKQLDDAIRPAAHLEASLSLMPEF